ncbi:MAG: cytoplasmic protein [Candidatus Marinimicrobia bacterium]|nr:cytoplasmic protein [Candidatus Neomarinimicrobiota bacterium]
MNFLKPKIIISKCLEFDACRYDGQLINNKYVEKLKKFIDFKPVCPEVQIGMGTPRKPIRIVRGKKKDSLFQSDTGLDFGEKMNKFSDKYISTIEGVDGFILKSASPSCGIKTAKVFLKDNPVPIGKDSGFFASKLIKKFPNHPKEEEKRLNNPFLREHFFTSIFTLADFKSVNDFYSLYNYHARHKYLFMSYNQTLMRKMGKIAANDDKNQSKTVIAEYYKNLLLMFAKKPRFQSNINTHMHIMGYFKKMLSSKEKKHFLEILDHYKSKKIPLSSVNMILFSWVVRFKNEYLSKQSFFNPFPLDLIEKENSRFL